MSGRQIDNRSSGTGVIRDHLNSAPHEDRGRCMSCKTHLQGYPCDSSLPCACACAFKLRLHRQHATPRRAPRLNDFKPTCRPKKGISSWTTSVKTVGLKASHPGRVIAPLHRDFTSRFFYGTVASHSLTYRSLGSRMHWILKSRITRYSLIIRLASCRGLGSQTSSPTTPWTILADRVSKN